jgi:hypothetical protein
MSASQTLDSSGSKVLAATYPAKCSGAIKRGAAGIGNPKTSVSTDCSAALAILRRVSMSAAENGCSLGAGLAACSASLPRKSKHGHTWPPPRASIPCHGATPPHEKSRVPKCSGKPMRSAHIQLNRHFRVRVLPPQPRSQSLSKSSGGPVSMVSGTMLRRLNAAFLLHRFRGGWPASNRNPGWHQFGIPGRNASESAASKWPVPP